ncbi:hypothetical protein HUJ05_003975 [Dendroctonus ponderosae]|nr:hypothetical protein HUJ05_003975 [Dendroctonus ponderosae]
MISASDFEYEDAGLWSSELILLRMDVLEIEINIYWNKTTSTLSNCKYDDTYLHYSRTCLHRVPIELEVELSGSKQDNIKW